MPTSGSPIGEASWEMTTRLGQPVSIELIRAALGIKGSRISLSHDDLEIKLKEFMNANPEVVETMAAKKAEAPKAKATKATKTPAAATKRTSAKKATATKAAATKAAAAKKTAASEPAPAETPAASTDADAEAPAQPAPKARKATSKKASASAKTSAGRRPRQIRGGSVSRRVLPGDRATLQEVQAWVDAQRRPLPRNFKPTQVEKAAHNKISYMTDFGQITVFTVDYKQMESGKIPWEKPDAQPSEVRKYAKKLASLSFLAENCEVCGKKLEDNSAEMSQVYQLLDGIAVLPYIGRKAKGKQYIIDFRRADLICRLLEKRLTDIVIAEAKGDVAEMDEALDNCIKQVTKEARQRRPKTTEADVEAKLEEVLEFIGSSNG